MSKTNTINKHNIDIIPKTLHFNAKYNNNDIPIFIDTELQTYYVA